MENQSNPDFKKNKINRKQFLRLAGLVLLIPLGRIWQVTVNKKKEETATQSHEIAVRHDLPDGVHFYGNVILVKSGEKIDLLSSKCTHLGCQINKTENNRLICPCHGSEYNFEGKPLKGPAINPLKKIDFTSVNTNQETVLRF
jgi:cytochrome b6-f complex iron-sulfur subunit